MLFMDLDDETAKSQKRQKMPPAVDRQDDSQLATVAPSAPLLPLGTSSSMSTSSRLSSAADALTRKARRVVIVTPVDSEGQLIEEGCEEREKAFVQLSNYLGGCNWTRQRYEAVFGIVNEAAPFGDHLWDGVVEQWRRYSMTDKNWWCVEET